MLGVAVVSGLGVVEGTAPAVSGWRPYLRWGWRGVMALGAGFAIVVFHDELPDTGALWDITLHADPAWLACMVVAQLASMSMFARVQRRLLQAGGVRMSLLRAVRMTYAGNALSTTLPAGPAVSVAFNFRQYRRAGASPRLATAVILLGGVIMTTAYAAVGFLALLAEPHSRHFATIALAVLATVIVAVAVAWRWRGADLVRVGLNVASRLAGPTAERLRLPTDRTRPEDPTDHTDHRGLAESSAPATRTALEIPADHTPPGAVVRLAVADWVALGGAAVLNWGFDILSLDAAARSVGLHPALYAVTIAYFAAQAAGSLLPLLPGGIGAIESSLAASLVAFGALAVPASAAVALYRLVSFWGVVGAGWVAWLAVRSGERGCADPGPVRRLLHRCAGPEPPQA